MSERSRIRFLALALLLFVGLVATPALASELDDAKAKGWVGEQVDGYIGVVDAKAPAAAQALVDRINAGRRAHYAKIAAESGTTLDIVAARAGALLVEKAPAGEFVKDSTGSWKRK